jgi:SET domain-containing protein
MLLVKTSVGESSIAGFGLFAAEPMAKGTVVAIFSHGLSVINEDEYIDRTLADDPIVIKTACRFVDRYYICRESGVEDEDYVNHSFSPNMLYHCGICFAKQDLGPGDELTVNYKYLLSQDEPGFHDVLTGKYVTGLTPLDALYQSSKELSGLMLTCLNEAKTEILVHPVARELLAGRKMRRAPRG